MDSSFFTATKEEIKEASSGGIPVFKAGEEVTFLIKEVTEKDVKGEKMLIIGTDVITGDNAGKKYAFFIRNNPTSKQVMFAILGALFTEDQITSGSLQYIMAVGKMVKSICKESPKKDGNGVWQNFYDFTEVSSTPEIGGGSAPLTVDDIPF